MSGQENVASASDKSGEDFRPKPKPKNYSITGRDVRVVKIKQLIEAMRPTAPEELGSTSFIERMETTAMICNAVGKDPGRYLDHLIKHKKHEVLVHEIVLISLWVEDILPHLFRNSKGKQTRCSCVDCGTMFSQPMTFCEATPAAFMMYQIYCCGGVNAILGKSTGALSLGTSILDVIDVSLQGCRNFLTRARDSSPGSIPCLTKSPAGELQPSLYTSGSFALFSLANLRTLVSNFESFPKYVLTKLIHPDTRFMLTLIELIEQKPWSSIKAGPTRSGSGPNGEEEDAFFQTMEGCVLEIIARYYIVINKAFPPDVAHLMLRDCSGRFLKILDKFAGLFGKNVLDRVKMELELAIARPEPNWEQPEPSPYHAKVRAELAEKKEAIIGIHGAMDTFEVTTVEMAKSRVARDFAFLHKTMKEKFCSYCKKPEARKKCSRCHDAWYCNRKCQSKHWATHKLTCKEPEA